MMFWCVTKEVDSGDWEATTAVRKRYEMVNAISDAANSIGSAMRSLATPLARAVPGARLAGDVTR